MNQDFWMSFAVAFAGVAVAVLSLIVSWRNRADAKDIQKSADIEKRIVNLKSELDECRDELNECKEDREDLRRICNQQKDEIFDLRGRVLQLERKQRA